MGVTSPGTTEFLSARLERRGQLRKLRRLFSEVLPSNAFQTKRLGEGFTCENAEDYAAAPFMTKQDLVADAAARAPWGSNLTYPIEEYTRFHQTSGTTGAPLRVLDDEESWNWWGRCWLEVLHAAGVQPEDRVFFAFSFAPFIGFWSAWQGVSMLGAMTISGAGMDSRRRLRMIFDAGCTVLLCTPTYALHLAEVAAREGFSLADSPVRLTIHAGEPGGSVAATRQRISETWGAEVYDHAGASEVGAFGVPDPEGLGVYLNEDEFVGEVIDPETLAPAAEGELGELALTNLGRACWPVIRYRTGDLVRAARRPGPDGQPRLFFEGGILGRVDDMITVRGVNVYPSALEDVIRQFAATAEFRLTATTREAMEELTIEVEADEAVGAKIHREIYEQMGFRVEVTSVQAEALPRWEGKARRFRDLREGREEASR